MMDDWRCQSSRPKALVKLISMTRLMAGKARAMCILRNLTALALLFLRCIGLALICRTGFPQGEGAHTYGILIRRETLPSRIVQFAWIELTEHGLWVLRLPTTGPVVSGYIEIAWPDAAT